MKRFTLTDRVSPDPAAAAGECGAACSAPVGEGCGALVEAPLLDAAALCAAVAAPFDGDLALACDAAFFLAVLLLVAFAFLMESCALPASGIRAPASPARARAEAAATERGSRTLRVAMRMRFTMSPLFVESLDGGRGVLRSGVAALPNAPRASRGDHATPGRSLRREAPGA